MIEKVRKSHLKFRKSAIYLNLPKKLTLAVDSILDTIEMSPKSYNSKSKYTIADEIREKDGVKISPTTVLKARKVLEDVGMVLRFETPNGNRVNKKCLLLSTVVKELPHRLELNEIERLKFDYFRTSKLNIKEIPTSLIKDFRRLEFIVFEKSKIREKSSDHYLAKDEEVLIQDVILSGENPTMGEKNFFRGESDPTIQLGSSLELPKPDKIVPASTSDILTTNVGYNNNQFLPSKFTVDDYYSKISNVDDLSLIQKVVSMSQDLQDSGFMVSLGYSKKVRQCRHYLRILGKEGRIRLVMQDFFNLKRFDSKLKYPDQIITWLGKDMKCLDFDFKDSYMLDIIKLLIPKALITNSPRGYHVFFKDLIGEVSGIKEIVVGDRIIEVKKVGQQVVFWDKNEKYSIISGDISDIGECRLGFLSSFLEHFGLEKIVKSVPQKVEFKSKFQSFLNGIFSKNSEKSRFILPGEISSGNRDEVLYRFAASMKARGFSSDCREIILNEINNERCSSPLKKSEIKSILKWVSKVNDKKEHERFVPINSVNDVNVCRQKLKK